MAEEVVHEMDELNIRVDEKTKKILYDILRRVISRMYTESMLVILVSRLRTQGKIESPQEIIEYMIREPLDFYKQVLEQFKEQTTTDAFIKTLFDEISKASATPPRGSEILETLHQGDKRGFQEKILEIIYGIRAKTTRHMY